MRTTSSNCPTAPVLSNMQQIEAHLEAHGLQPLRPLNPLPQADPGSQPVPPDQQHTEPGVVEKPKLAPEPTYYELIPWARANSLGTNAVYEFCRRKRDPIPHIKRGRKYLIEHEAALAWLKRTQGPQPQTRR